MKLGREIRVMDARDKAPPYRAILLEALLKLAI